MGNILVSMSLVIPANEAKLGMDFGPVIGQYGLNIKVFCDNFNNITKKVYKGIPLRVYVNIFKDKNFEIIVKGFDLRFFIDFFTKDNVIRSKDLFCMYLLQKRLIKYYPNIKMNNDFSEIRCLLNYIRVLGIKCMY